MFFTRGTYFVPGISALVRSIVLDKIRSRFVWPNKFKLYLPMPTQANDFPQVWPPKQFYSLSLFHHGNKINESSLGETLTPIFHDIRETSSSLTDPFRLKILLN